MKRKVPVQKGKLKVDMPSVELMTPAQNSRQAAKQNSARRSGQKLKKVKR